MSAIEEEAKPALLKSFASGSTRLSHLEAAALSTWAVLKALVGEHSREERLTPMHEREKFRIDRVIPVHFRIFLATHPLETKAAFERHSATFATRDVAHLEFLPEGMKRNSQLITMLVGKYYFHITSLRSNGMLGTVLDPKRPMAQLFPRTLEGPVEPPLVSALDIQINANAMNRLINSPGVLYVPDGTKIPPG